MRSGPLIPLYAEKPTGFDNSSFIGESSKTNTTIPSGTSFVTGLVGAALACHIRRKNDPDKPEIAARLRKETTLTLKQITGRLNLGTSKGCQYALHKWMRRGTVGALTACQMRIFE